MTIHHFLAPLLILQMVYGVLAQQTGTPRLGPPPPSPQQSPQKPNEDDVVKITTNLVQVDAVVTDKSGKVVTDLKPDEVEIFEDGHKQKITNFSFSLSANAPTRPTPKPIATDRSLTAAPPPALRREDIKRTIAIVVDDLGLS